jgi:hypothetical protein
VTQIDVVKSLFHSGPALAQAPYNSNVESPRAFFAKLLHYVGSSASFLPRRFLLFQICTASNEFNSFLNSFLDPQKRLAV